MTFKTEDENARFRCPRCDTLMEDTIGDYVIQGCTGRLSRSTEQCFKCDERFCVEFNGNEYIVVEL